MTERHFPETAELVFYQGRRDAAMVVFDGDVYRNQDDGPNGEPLTDFDESEYVEVSRLRRHNCEYGDYPWDHWQEWALADGVPTDLAQLGRDLIREADQHNWPRERQLECGWGDSGAAMIQLALTAPDQARERWEFLMETDGDRGLDP